jgi:adenylate cyclase
MQLREPEAAVDLLGPYFDQVSRTQLNHCAVDPDMDPLREHPRFRAMVDAAEARVAEAEAATAH